MAGRDLAVMAETRLAEMRPNRLNIDRVNALSPENPEIENLRSLCGGMVVEKPPNFRPNALCEADLERLALLQRCFFHWAKRTESEDRTQALDPDIFPCAEAYNRKLHPSYVRTSEAVNRMLSDLHADGVGFVLPGEMVRKFVTCHLMLGKWVAKFGKHCGRNIGDMSFCLGPHLNGDWAKDAAAARYGAIRHPRIDEIATMVVDFYDEEKRKDPSITVEDLVFYTTDVKGAYTKLSLPAAEVCLFGQQLT